MTSRVYARDLLPAGTGEARAVEEAAARARALSSFRAFLPYWKFRNRENGDIQTFEELWEGQERLAGAMEEHPWLFALKAGKLGFTELECAFDAWVALRRPNARVHIFSKDLIAAQSLLDYVRFGLERLPAFLRLDFAPDIRGGDTGTSLILRASTDDQRTIVAYAAGRRVAIDQSAMHSHVDELAHMPWPKLTWSAIQTTVVPDGSVHIVTRGAGDANFVATLWEAAQAAGSKLHPIFEPWTSRPDHDRAWRDSEAELLPPQQLLHYLPESPEDALAGDETAIYIDSVTWDACFDPDLPELIPGDRQTPIVLGVDAAVSSDCAAIVAVSRHPIRRDEAAIRACKVWRPEDSGGRINLTELDLHVRFICEGGCRVGHPRSSPVAGCQHCAEPATFIPGHRVVQIAYDAFQLEEMGRRWMRDRMAWTKPFPQTTDRLIADANLMRLAYQGRLSHNGSRVLQEHVGNARAKLYPDDDSRVRIVKASPSRKVDLVVATSMGVHRCLELPM